VKETEFIAQNKDKWANFEQSYATERKDPERLSSLYVDMIEDLGYAQTFYSRRTVRVYLNRLASKVFLGVHKFANPEKRTAVFDSLFIDLPLEIYRTRKAIFFSFLSFLLYAFLGAITTYYYPDFPRTILGNGYVEQTLTNIENGNPLAIYDKSHPWMMFYAITSNNLQVAFLVFALGFFATLGSHILLFFNGVMLGSFQLFFASQGLLQTSFLGIWIHGSFEISTIILAGAAGITLGKGWLFPKNYTRRQSQQMAIFRSLKLMFTLVPFIILAGFLESFITRHYQLFTDWSKWAIIFFSFALIIFYYLVYPMLIARRYPNRIQQIEHPPFQKTYKLVAYKIRTLNMIFRDAFRAYLLYSKKFFPVLFTILFPIALFITIIQGYLHLKRMYVHHFFDWYAHLQIIFGYGLFLWTDLLAGLSWSVLFALFFASIFWSVHSGSESFSYRSFFSYLKKNILSIYAAICLPYVLFFFTPLWLKPVLLFLLPFFFFQLAHAGLALDSPRFFGSLLSIKMKSYRTSFLLLLLFSILIVLAFQPVASLSSIHSLNSIDPFLFPDLLDFLSEFVYDVARVFDPNTALYYSNVVRQIVYLCCIFIMLPVFVLLISFFYYSQVEQEQAISLQEAYKQFSREKKI